MRSRVFFFVLFFLIRFHSSYEMGQSVGWSKTGEPWAKYLTHRQVHILIVKFVTKKGFNLNLLIPRPLAAIVVTGELSP